MKLLPIFAAMLLAFTLAACGQPTTPTSAGEGPDGVSYGTTHEGEAIEGRNAPEAAPESEEAAE